MDEPVLTEMQLAYRFCLEAGFEVLGDERAFALLTADLGKQRYLAVFGDLPVAQGVLFEAEIADEAMRLVQRLKGSFAVVPEGVICRVCDITSVGTTYVNAAMRALVRNKARRAHAGIENMETTTLRSTHRRAKGASNQASKPGVGIDTSGAGDDKS